MQLDLHNDYVRFRAIDYHTTMNKNVIDEVTGSNPGHSQKIFNDIRAYSAVYTVLSHHKYIY